MMKASVFFFVTLFVFSVPTFAEQNQKKVFTVGVEEMPFMPFSEVKDGEYRGVFRELLDKFFKEQGFVVQYIPLPVARLYADFYSNKVDFKIPANPYWQKDIKEQKGLKIFYSRSILSYTDGVLIKKGQKEKLKIQKLGVVLGFTPWEYLKDIKSGDIKLVENPNLKSLLRQTVMGRVDGAYSNISVANHYQELDQTLRGKLVFDPKLPHTKSHYMLSSQKHHSVIRKFNEFLKKNKIFIKALQRKTNGI